MRWLLVYYLDAVVAGILPGCGGCWYITWMRWVVGILPGMRWLLVSHLDAVVVGVGHDDLLVGTQAEAVWRVELTLELSQLAELGPDLHTADGRAAAGAAPPEWETRCRCCRFRRPSLSRHTDTDVKTRSATGSDRLQRQTHGRQLPADMLRNRRWKASESRVRKNRITLWLKCHEGIFSKLSGQA